MSTIEGDACILRPIEKAALQMCFLPVHEQVDQATVLALSSNRKYLACGEVAQRDQCQVKSLQVLVCKVSAS